MLQIEMLWMVQKIIASGDWLGIMLKLIEALCATVILLSIAIDFLEFDEHKESKEEKKSVVTTLTMSLYFILFIGVLYLHIGQLNISPSTNLLFIFFGEITLIIGTFFNVKGRLNLGKQWGDQIIIHKDHQIIEDGVYSVVRHPLYASLIWLSFGLSLIYINWVTIFLNIVVFIPFMYYRARQEEVLLSKHFPQYKLYKERVSMFLPNMNSIKVYFAKSKLEEIDLNALTFCKWASALIIWTAIILGNYYILLIILINFLLSVLFSVKNSPIVLIYTYTFGLVIKKRIGTIDIQDFRFVHLIAFVFCIISIVPLFFGNNLWFWIPAIMFAILKTITALGYCPASKLRSCLLNNGGKCCKFSGGAGSCNA
jgi:protein-S-isoprenylcysteine O-methyltransferase Ste14